MFRSQQHREKAAAYGELIKRSSDQGESGKFQKTKGSPLKARRQRTGTG